MVLKNCKSTAEYYQEYYLRHKDRYKYLYYSKKLEDEQKKNYFKEYGGEAAFYKNYYIKWNLGNVNKNQ